MEDEREYEPPQRRFGPVTLLAIAGATILGLLGVVVARLTNYAEAMRGILVSFIFAGAMLGICAGVLVERRAKLPGKLRRFPWHWFRFSLRAILILTTAVALYAALFVNAVNGTAAQGGFNPWLFATTLIYNLPKTLIWLLASIALMNRWAIHPRASKLALSGILLGVCATFFAPILSMWMFGFAQGGGQSASLLLYSFYFTQYLVEPIGLALILAAVLADRGETAPPKLGPDTGEEDREAR